MTTPTPHQIIVVGSINTDMVITTEALPRPGQTVLGSSFSMNAGGKGANQAVAAARLGGAVTMVGNLGADTFGELAISQLLSEGVNCRFISKDDQSPSGVALISVDANGENQIVVAPGANHTLGKAQISQALASLNHDSLVLLQLEIPLSCVSYAIALANSVNSKVILDPAPAQHLSSEILSGLYLITPNKTEATSLTGIIINNFDDAKFAADKLLSGGVKNVAITLGPQGVLLVNADGSKIIKAPLVQAIDTTAAGDCFNGALAAALTRGNSLHDATVFACSAAAISVTRQGAQSSMPSQLELK